MVGYLIQSCDISHETTHFKLELFASSSFTYEAKIIMLANGLWPGAYSQLSGTLYGFLDRSSPLSSTHWALPPAFPLFCLVSAWVTPIVSYLLSFAYHLSIFLCLVRSTWYKPTTIISAAAAARWWMTVWQWSCQDLLLYDILNDRLLRFQMATVSFKFLD